MSDFFRKHSMITGTLLLTAAGFAVRILGFFYRIFLSRTIGAEGLGLYNLVHPLYGICFALCAGSIQTAISRCIAANLSRRKLFLRTGLMISLSIAVILAMILSAGSQFLADQILLESRCGEFLRLMALSIPFSAIHACVNGYYYGMQRTRVPAASQITEQLIRMGVVFLLVLFFQAEQIPITTELAVLGHLAGEAGSCFYAALTFLIFDHTVSSLCLPLTSPIVLSTLCAGRELMSMALPLMGNRLVLNLLSSAEAIWIPSRLVLSGLTSREAFELYGVLTGMALPFIFFPSAITNSMAVILLPAVAGAQADGREHHIREAVLTSLRYSLYMGILCVGLFTRFGPALGETFYHNADAGRFIQILSWLCPFLYLSTTMGSILNGLGKTGTVFVHHTVSMLLTLSLVLFAIPRWGIFAYLAALLISELVLAFLHIHALACEVPIRLPVSQGIVKPSFCLLVSIGMLEVIPNASYLPHLFPPVLIQSGILCLLYIGGLLLLHTGTVKQ